MKNEIVFTYYVFGDYTRYIPFCVYSVIKSYPESYVKIFVDGKLKDNEKKSLDYLDKSKFEIKESYKLPVNFRANMKGGNLKAARWILPYEEFKDFEYVYVGDIDMLIVKEEPSLIESHIEHMNKTGLPFSNGIRKNTTRLTGLHFFKTDEYFNKMNNLINRCLNDGKYLSNLTLGCKRNEHFLYKIVEMGIGFGNVKERITKGGDLHYRPHHGAHLGLFRGKIPDRLERLELIPEYLDDPIFNKILKINKIQEVIDLKKVSTVK